MTPHMLQRRCTEEAGLLFKMNFLERVALWSRQETLALRPLPRNQVCVYLREGTLGSAVSQDFRMFSFFCADTFLLSNQKKQKRF